MQFLEDNQSGQPFYLLVDCFDPHEPWEAPEAYYRLYAPSDYAGRRIVHCTYAPVDIAGYTEEEVAYVRAQYRGLVSFVDCCFGRLMERLDALALSQKTAVFLISDHGTNFCDNPRRVIGKPANAMYPAVMRLPLIAKFPDEVNAGTVCDDIVYNLDLTATLYDLAGANSSQPIDGQPLSPLVQHTLGWLPRKYVTCRYGNSVCYIDDKTWALGDIQGTLQEVFDLTEDPCCTTPLPPDAAEILWNTAWARLLTDAGGPFPDYSGKRRTDAIGQRDIVERQDLQP